MDENPLSPHAIAFVRKFLPPEVPDPHSLLYDWDHKYAFIPTRPVLEACLDEYGRLLTEAGAAPGLEALRFEVLNASELTLAYLNRTEKTQRALVPEHIRANLNSVLDRIISATETFMGGRFRDHDGVKRMAAIKEILAEGSAPRS